MKLAEKLIQSLSMSEMAFNRATWVDRVRDRFLGGALGEFTKLHISRKISVADNWSYEVQNLLGKVEEYLSPQKVITKQKFDREKALLEAISEASTFQDQVTNAKNEMVKYYPKKRKAILTLKLDSREMMKLMLKEFWGKVSTTTK